MKKSIFPNIYYFLLLTRIVRREIEKNPGTFNESDLREHIIKLNNPELSANTFKVFLKEDIANVTISMSINTLNNFFKLIGNSKFGRNWDEFIKIQEDELQLSSETIDVINIFEKNKEQIIEFFDIKSGHSQFHELINKNSPEEIKEIYPSINNLIINRLDQIYLQETIKIKNLSFSKCEIKLIYILNYINIDQLLEAKTIIDKYFASDVLTIDLIFHRLINKGVLIKDDQNNLVYEIKLNISQSIINHDEINRLFKELGYYFEQRFNDSKRNLNYLYLSVHLFQHSEMWEKVSILYRDHFDYFKRYGIYSRTTKLIEEYINTDYFYKNTNPWLLWLQSNLYNFSGELTKASMTIEKLFNYLWQECTLKNEITPTIDPKHIKIFVKSFQLSLDILLNYDNELMLKAQFNGMKLFAIQYLQVPMYSKELYSDICNQLLISIARYYYKTGNNIAFEMIQNLFDDFFSKEKSQTTASINIALIELQKRGLPSLKYKWARYAYRTFKFKNNYSGMWVSLLYLILYEEDDVKRDIHIESFIYISKRCHLYYPLAIDLLEKVKKVNQDPEYELYFNKLINRQVNIKKQIDGSIGTSINIYNLLGRSVNIQLGVIGEKEVEELFWSLSHPLHRKTVNFDSIDAQNLLNSNLDNRMNFLRRTFNLTSNETQFFANPLNRRLLIRGLLNPTESYLFLDSFFNTKSIVVISKLKDIKVKLEFVKALTKIKIYRAKIILDSIENDNEFPEYFNQMANFYSISKEKDYHLACQYYQKSIELNTKLNVSDWTYYNNLGWHILRFGIKEDFKKAYLMFRNSLKSTKNYQLTPKPFHGLIISIVYCNLDGFKPKVVGNKIIQEFTDLDIMEIDIVKIINNVLRIRKSIVMKEKSKFILIKKSLKN